LANAEVINQLLNWPLAQMSGFFSDCWPLISILFFIFWRNCNWRESWALGQCHKY